MSEDDLTSAATRAAGEPVGDGDVDPEALGDLAHAVDVLKGATADPDPARREDLNKAIGDRARIFKLYHFAAAAVIMFVIGLVALAHVAISPPRDLAPTVAMNRPPAGQSNQAPDNRESTSAVDEPGKQDTQPEDSPLARTEWIREQVALGEPAEGAGTSSGGGIPFGGPAGASGGGHGTGAPGETMLDKLRALDAGFERYHWPGPDRGMSLRRVELVAPRKSGTAFAIVRVVYANPSGEKLVVLQAGESPRARGAFDTDGLAGNVYTALKGDTRVLLIANAHDREALSSIAAELAPAG